MLPFSTKSVNPVLLQFHLTRVVKKMKPIKRPFFKLIKVPGIRILRQGIRVASIETIVSNFVLNVSVK